MCVYVCVCCECTVVDMRKLGDKIMSEAEEESRAIAQEMEEIRVFVAAHMEYFVPVAVAVPIAMVEASDARTSEACESCAWCSLIKE